MFATFKTFKKSLSILCFSLLLSGLVPIAVYADATGYTGDSQNWAGYTAMEGSYTAVSGSWTVPQTLSSIEEKVNAEWIGIGGTNSNDLLQSGTEAITRDGRVDYVAWYEALPNNPVTLPVQINAGDFVSVSFTYQGNSLWLLKFVNNTTGESYSNSINYNSSFSSVEWIEERPRLGDTFMPLADFGSIVFQNGSAVRDGVTQTLVDINARPLVMTENGKVLATPSYIGSDRSTFSVSIPGSSRTTNTNQVLVPVVTPNITMAPAPDTNRVSSSVVTVSVATNSAEALKIQILEAIIVRLKALINLLLIQKGLAPRF